MYGHCGHCTHKLYYQANYENFRTEFTIQILHLFF